MRVLRTIRRPWPVKKCESPHLENGCQLPGEATASRGVETFSLASWEHRRLAETRALSGNGNMPASFLIAPTAQRHCERGATPARRPRFLSATK